MPNTAHQLRAARLTSGMSQVELAKASSTDQSLISHVESGSRDTRTRTLDRLMSTMGHQMVAIDSVELTALDTAITMRRWLARQRPDEAGKALQEFSAGLHRVDAATMVALTHSQPLSTEHRRWDAALAQVIEFRLDAVSAPMPAWLRSSGLLGDEVAWLDVASQHSTTSPHPAHNQ
ncbi:helix-turn-helix protein [Rhodoglobus vestalii]|uniref:Helix-turn-helix protein n=1 Tax=Rhodoglobus vestalii TaxID=193384 RepID=A0A8H2K6E5_9MICO|nr:helix-turn-helix transcriptional regulator [Rhodoglobus vestalii]TQO18506.1 helix-turn-helix protein [Rhodoglobus vestalii]